MLLRFPSMRALLATAVCAATSAPVGVLRPAEEPEFDWAVETEAELWSAGAIPRRLTVVWATESERSATAATGSGREAESTGAAEASVGGAERELLGPPVPTDFHWPGVDPFEADLEPVPELPPPAPPPPDWRRHWPKANDGELLLGIMGVVGLADTPWARATRVEPPLGLASRWRADWVQRRGERLVLWPAIRGAPETSVRLAVAIAATEPPANAAEQVVDWLQLDDAQFAARCVHAGLWRARVRAWVAQRAWRNANFARFFDARVARVRAVDSRFRLRDLAAGVLGEAMLRRGADAPAVGAEGQFDPAVLTALATAAKTMRPRSSQDVLAPDRMRDPDRRSPVITVQDADPGAVPGLRSALGLPADTRVVATTRVGALGLSALVGDPRRGLAAALCDTPSAWRLRAARGWVGDRAYSLAAADGRRIGVLWWCGFEERAAATEFVQSFERLRQRVAQSFVGTSVVIRRGRTVAVAFGLEETAKPGEWRESRLPRWLEAMEWVDGSGRAFDPLQR